jgi:hypothetical protein
MLEEGEELAGHRRQRFCYISGGLLQCCGGARNKRTGVAAGCCTRPHLASMPFHTRLQAPFYPPPSPPAAAAVHSGIPARLHLFNGTVCRAFGRRLRRGTQLKPVEVRLVGLAACMP